MYSNIGLCFRWTLPLSDSHLNELNLELEELEAVVGGGEELVALRNGEQQRQETLRSSGSQAVR